MAVFLGTAWIAVLCVADAALLLRTESLRHHVDQALAEVFRSRVTYGAFEGGWPGRITLRDVRVMDPDRPREVLVAIEKVRIVVDWTGVAFGGAPVDEVRLVNPSMTLEWNEHGRLEIPSPLAETRAGPSKGLPRISVEGLRLKLLHSPYLARGDVDIQLPNFEVALIPYRGEKWLYQFEAAIGDDQFGDLRAHGLFSETAVDIELSRKGFVVTERMKDLVQPDVADLLSRFHVDGDLEILAELETVPADDGGSPGDARFQVQINLDGVTLRARDWPQQLRNLRGIVIYKDGRLEAERITGSFADAPLWFGGHVDLTGGAPDISIRGQLLDLRITDAFVDDLAHLPHPGPEVKEQLYQWAVRGPADIDFSLTQRPQIGEELRLVPHIVVHLKDCKLKFQGAVSQESGVREGFPYPLEHLRGQIELDDRGLAFSSLRATQGPLSLQARGTVDYSRSDDTTYQAHVWTTGLRIDDHLFSALDADTAGLLRDLRARGSVDVQVIARRTPADPVGIAPEIIITLGGIALTPERFPYRLEDVRGEVVIGRDHRISIDGLSVRHGTTRLSAHGTIGIGPNDGQLDGEVFGENVAVDEDLLRGLDVLAPDVAKTIRDLRPSGAIRRLSVAIKGDPKRRDPEIDATLYLHDIGLAPKDPGVTVTSIDAVVDIWHGQRRKEIAIRRGASGRFAGEALSGEGRFRPGRDWVLKLNAKDFQVDDELLDALQGLLPILKNKAVRPKLKGRATADVTITDTGDGAQAVAIISTRDMYAQPPTWTETWLDGIQCMIRVDGEGMHVRDFAARIPRPRTLPPLPLARIRPSGDSSGGNQRFQTDPAIFVHMPSGGIFFHGDRVRIGMSDVELKNVPLEPWVLDILGMSRKERAALKVPPLAGVMNLRFTSANLGTDRVVLNGGHAELFGVNLGADGELYLQDGTLKNVDLVMNDRGEVEFGGDRTEFVANNFRIFGVPIPRLEARLHGDRLGAALTEIDGVVFGFEYDAFDLETATPTELRRRAARYVSSEDAVKRSDAQLRALIESKEGFDYRHANLDQLRDHVQERGYLGRWRAGRMDEDQLRHVIERKRGARSLGVLWGEDTRLSVTWGGTFNLDAHVRDVNIGSAVKSFGGNPGKVRGMLSTRLRLSGDIADLATWKGSGWVSAEAANVVQLPFFLNILKAIDVTTWIASGRRTRLHFGFDIADSLLTLKKGGWLTGEGVKLELMSGHITFGGIISARLNAKHGGFIPGLSELLAFLPSLILDGVVVEGPLEDPKVEARSLGLGSDEPGTSRGRKPRMKPAKKKL
ncbi:MAG: hypothetical protein CMJ83_18150 [Planctomycetes bacterium]|nr:hypothetical protein [Planctomycetota bacterium]